MGWVGLACKSERWWLTRVLLCNVLVFVPQLVFAVGVLLYQRPHGLTAHMRKWPLRGRLRAYSLWECSAHLHLMQG